MGTKNVMMTETKTFEIQKVATSRIQEVDLTNPRFGLDYTDHMFISDFQNGEWTNERIVPFENLSLSPANATLHYAQSIFEGLKAHRTENGDVLIFRAEANADRMIKSAERMCMPPVTKELFMESIHQLVKLDEAWVPSAEGRSLYIRPFQFATDPYIGVKPSEKYSYMVIIGPVGSYYSKPVRVKIEKHFTRAARGGVGAAKTAGNYAASLYPAKLAQEQGYDQLIWTDGSTHEYIEECGTMNLMFVIDGKIITPSLNDSILPGITRDSALTLARDWGYEIEERPIRVAELIGALKDGRMQEAFGIGTAATISHISCIGNEGIDYEMPPVEDMEISNRILQTLTDIKLGKAEDKFGWMTKV